MPRRVQQGVVVSDKMNRTVVVKIERRFMHPLLKKTIVRSKRYKAHDPENSCRVGDNVRIEESKPLSKTKKWLVLPVK